MVTTCGEPLTKAEKPLAAKSSGKANNPPKSKKPPTERGRARSELDDGAVAAAAKSQQIILSSQTYSGPLPHPSILDGYEKVVPGSARTIIDQFVAQSQHRMAMEARVIKGDAFRATIGVWMAGAISLLSIAAGCFLVWQGKELVGSLFGGIPLGTIVFAFIYGTRSRQKERQTRAAANPAPQEPNRNHAGQARVD